MARTIAQIQQSMLDAVAADATLSGNLTSTSKVAIWRLWTYIIAFCQWTLEVLFDSHKTEVTTIIATQKPHGLQWYVTIAKLFQYGYALPPDSDTYGVIDTDAQIVTYAAAEEVTKGLRIKAAKLDSGDLASLSATELTAFTAYMEAVRDAGVRLYIESNDPDSLKLTLTIYYNALVLDSSGQRLDGTNNTPVQDAITAYLQKLPFNGLFIINKLIDALEVVEGVVIANVALAQAKYGALAYSDIIVEYQPDAGYLRINDPVTDLTITFTPHVPV